MTGAAIAKFVELPALIARWLVATAGAIERCVAAAMIVLRLVATAGAIERCVAAAAMIVPRLAATAGRIAFESSAIELRSGGTGGSSAKAGGAGTAAVTAAPDQAVVDNIRGTGLDGLQVTNCRSRGETPDVVTLLGRAPETS